MATVNIWDMIDVHLQRKPPLVVERLPTFYPSAASCISETSGQVVGSCARENYYRCAGYDKSDLPNVWSEYVFAGGKIWEQWTIDKLKEMGLLKAANLKFVDLERYISGELDVVITDPEGGEKPVILEMKTFYGYDAHVDILGNMREYPKPKDSNLLQAFLYLGQFIGQVEKVYLLYFARDDHARQQFKIEMVQHNGKHYPKISTFWQKQPGTSKEYSYIDYGISLENIYQRYEELMNNLKDGKMPKGDYRHSYTDEEIEAMFKQELLSKTAYEKWKKEKDNFAVGHWKCRRYCDYRTMCLSQKKADGDL